MFHKQAVHLLILDKISLKEISSIYAVLSSIL